jgi:hypothetical protein
MPLALPPTDTLHRIARNYGGASPLHYRIRIDP